MPPRKPGALFCSAKLALRAAAEASCELRFCSWRPANLLTEDCGWYGCQRFYHFQYLERRSRNFTSIQERRRIVRPVDVRMKKSVLICKDGGRQTGSSSEREDRKRSSMTYASTLSSATIGSGTANILALPLCKCANAATDVVAEESFVPSVGHGCSKFANSLWVLDQKNGVDMVGERIEW